MKTPNESQSIQNIALEKRNANNAESEKPALNRQHFFYQTGGVIGQFLLPAATIAAIVLNSAPLFALMPSVLVAVGLLLGLLFLSAVIGNFTGRLLGAGAEYITRPAEMNF